MRRAVADIASYASAVSGAVVAILLSVGGCSPSGPPIEELETLAPEVESETEIYVPENLEDALAELERVVHPVLLKRMRAGSEQDMHRLHFRLGGWLRNRWGLWQGSRLSRYFNEIGIHHADDMSSILLDSLWRHLNDEPIRLDEQVAFYQAYWRQHMYPLDALCPEHQAALEWRETPDVSASDSGRVEHAFECVAGGEIWGWQVDDGFFKPDAEFLDALTYRQLEESEARPARGE